jgi:peptide/nickel transport system ATP-binding protein
METLTRGAVLLDVEHLSVVYDSVDGPVCAVDDVSFTLRRGEILGLAGESGSGKSTPAYALARLLRPPARVAAGRVLYYSRQHTVHGSAGLEREEEGRDLYALDRKALRTFRWSELAVVLQSAMKALNPVATFEAQISDVIRAHRPGMTKVQRRARLVELARLVGIAPERLKSYPHELSGGMRQRAVIAIALALASEVIIMDEPTTALDVVIQRELLTELLRLRQQLGFAVIFITHDLSLLLEIADEIMIMYAGQLVEQAGRVALYRRPLHPYTDGLLHSFPTLDGPLVRMSGIPGAPPDLYTLPSGCVFHPRCPKAWERCQRELPALLPPGAAGEEEVCGRRVACHLYGTYRREQELALYGQGGEV